MLQIESVTPIGTGQMAESYRVTFAPGTHGQLSNSVVVKVPSQSESSRGASRVTRCYELETSFYATLKSKVGRRSGAGRAVAWAGSSRPGRPAQVIA